MKKVAVIMGSDSDWPVVKGACQQLETFGIPYEAHILSAHRTPAAAADLSVTHSFYSFAGQTNWMQSSCGFVSSLPDSCPPARSMSITDRFAAHRC